MNIRTANMKDLDKITEMERICFPEEEAAERETFEERLTYFPNHFWILEDDGAVICFINGASTDSEELTDEMYKDASMHDESGAWQMIFGVGTIPEYRNRGCAEKLMNHVIEEARKQKRKGLVLTCKEGLIHYYAKLGFVEEGLSGSHHGGAVWYKMRLTF